MTKFLILLLIIAVLAIIGVSFVFKSIKKVFSVLNPNDPQYRTQSGKRNNDNVIYSKDDVVVLKGEADKKAKDKNKSNRFFNNNDDKND